MKLLGKDKRLSFLNDKNSFKKKWILIYYIFLNNNFENVALLFTHDTRVVFRKNMYKKKIDAGKLISFLIYINNSM